MVLIICGITALSIFILWRKSVNFKNKHQETIKKMAQKEVQAAKWKRDVARLDNYSSQKVDKYRGIHTPSATRQTDSDLARQRDASVRATSPSLKPRRNSSDDYSSFDSPSSSPSSWSSSHSSSSYSSSDSCSSSSSDSGGSSSCGGGD